MTAEHILDAIGLLDDQLIQQSEQYGRSRRGTRYGRWLGLAASFAIVLFLGYGLTHLGMGGGMPHQGAGSTGAPASGNDLNQTTGSVEAGPPEDEGTGGEILPGATPQPPAANDSSDGIPGEADICDAIMVDGVLYWSTGEAVPVEVDEDAIQKAVSYTSSLPEMDGQTNFSPDLSVQYAKTEVGLVVRIDQEWILFDTVPPWEEDGGRG